MASTDKYNARPVAFGNSALCPSCRRYVQITHDTANGDPLCLCMNCGYRWNPDVVKLMPKLDSSVKVLRDIYSLNPLERVFMEKIARICHNVNKAYCEALRDTYQTSWENAPLWQKESAIKGVYYHLSNPDTDASASHSSWYWDKAQDDWTWGPEKDAEKKTHPRMVPFDQLTKEQQAKDFIFKEIVSSVGTVL